MLRHLGWLAVGTPLVLGVVFARQPAVGPASAPASPDAPQTERAPATAAPGRSLRNANYSIDVRLDPRARSLTGREVLTWRNMTTTATSELQFHLYYNAWTQPRGTAMRGSPGGGENTRDLDSDDTGGWTEVSTIEMLTSDGAIDLTERSSFLTPDDASSGDQTVMAVALPDVVAPGEEIRIAIEWVSRVPQAVDGTGVLGRSLYHLAHWFPQLGVFEDDGWNCPQVRLGSETYADYGVYDIRMTVPTTWVVGATGQERERRDNGDGSTTHRYYQEDVADFAWVTGPDLVDLRDSFEHETLPPVEIRLLLQPEHRRQGERYFDAASMALAALGEWFGGYPYGHITIVDLPARGSDSRGYPTLVVAGTRLIVRDRVAVPEGSVAQGVASQFWSGLVGHNGFENGWLGQGLSAFARARLLDLAFDQAFADGVSQRFFLDSDRFFGGFVPVAFENIRYSRVTDEGRLHRYRLASRRNRPPVSGGGSRLSEVDRMATDKTALWLHALERYLGWPTLQRILSAYYERWGYGHPTPDDFFTLASEVSGRDLGWFFEEVRDGAGVFDYGIREMTSDPASVAVSLSEGDPGAPLFLTTVVVERNGDAIFPGTSRRPLGPFEAGRGVEVLVTFADGTEVREHWDGRARATRFSYESMAPATSAQVDPSRLFCSTAMKSADVEWYRPIPRPNTGRVAHIRRLVSMNSRRIYRPGSRPGAMVGPCLATTTAWSRINGSVSRTIAGVTSTPITTATSAIRWRRLDQRLTYRTHTAAPATVAMSAVSADREPLPQSAAPISTAAPIHRRQCLVRRPARPTANRPASTKYDPAALKSGT